jgi:hypothetical protein
MPKEKFARLTLLKEKPEEDEIVSTPDVLVVL